ncbi:PEP-CTERM sorting domain-containing protein [Haloferula chungangensis]|uniref:PEP-CTERM sorting domain-containing protein n=1 Tax=Haloferula chungangensis TaxID=1048331 RepID=A0ABW2L889_9BACT
MNILHSSKRSLSCIVLPLLALSAACDATVIGFGQLGGNNATVSSTLASRAVADGSGYVVDNGATPNISLGWDSNWDIHTSTWFTDLENFTVGGGDWDNEGGVPRVGQLDGGLHTISLISDPGFALVINSFDFVHTLESSGTTVWNLSLTDSLTNVVWSETLNMDNSEFSSSLQTVSPGFTGADGESYTLTFERSSSSYASNGRHAIDNFSFNQVAVPEPSSALLICLGAMGLFRRRR